MKTVLLLLLVLLAKSVSAETFVPYTPDSLQKGDWLTIESVLYYPYIAPGIKEELPWRAENIRRVTIQTPIWPAQKFVVITSSSSLARKQEKGSNLGS